MSNRNNLGLLFLDEFKGFWKSKVMIVLWIGMPVLAILLYAINPDMEGLPLSLMVGLLIASIGGTLSSVMLSTTIVSERTHHVYDLFVIRNSNIRSGLILAKFLAVYFCIIIAALISTIVGGIIDQISNDIPFETAWEQGQDAFTLAIGAMAIACAVGILLGLVLNSVPTAAILSIYLGNQLSILAMLPSILLEGFDPGFFALTIGGSLTVILLVIDVIIFNKKQL